MTIPLAIRSHSLLEYASMCADTYNGDEIPTDHILLECGWERVPGGSWPTGDFFARLYGHRHSKRTILAYRGTHTLANWGHNAQLTILNGVLTSSYIALAKEAYQKAIAYTTQNNNFHPPIAVTGHSLGGCLAQIAAIDVNRVCSKNREFPLYAITFNGLQVADNILGSKNLELMYSYILNYNIETDVVHKFIRAPHGSQQHLLPGDPYTASLYNELMKPQETSLAARSRQAIETPSVMKDFAGLTVDEHLMKSVLENLWIKFEDPHGEDCIPVRPSNVKKHEAVEDTKKLLEELTAADEGWHAASAAKKEAIGRSIDQLVSK